MYNNKLWEPVETFTYKGHLEEFTLKPDTYLFVANGACGGRQPVSDTRNDFIPWGGTTYGILDLDHTQTFYAAVGGAGTNSKGSTVRTAGGWNGGGSGGASAKSGTINGAAGGGATDVRLSSAENTVEEEPVYVPHGYDQVECLTTWLGDPDYWVSGQGNIINTGYIIKPNTKIELVIETKPPGEAGPGTRNAGAIFGAWGSQTESANRAKATSCFDGLMGTSGFIFHLNNTNGYCSSSFYGHGKTKIILDGTTLSYETEDGITNSVTLNTDRVQCEYPMYIFSINDNGRPYSTQDFGYPNKTYMRFYYMKIWEDDTLVHWYVPIARSTDDGHIEPDTTYDGSNYRPDQREILKDRGVFDLVNKKMYFGIVKHSSDAGIWGPFCIADPYFGIGPHVAPIDQDHYSTKTVQKINGASSRILVAGGGGGAAVMFNTNNVQNFYSFGGGAISGAIFGSNITANNNAGLRATQTSGYSFGVGEDADDKEDFASSGFSYGNTGIAGGGGGWYGGYSIICKGNTLEAYTAYGGTGGSSYILTEDSYKPTGYMEGFTDIMESLYFRDGLMLPFQAFDGASLEVYKEATVAPFAGDKIVIPFTGTWQGTTLVPSRYKFKCYGGDGATNIYTRSAAKGGYAEGVLTLHERTPLYFHVGSSQYIYATECDTVSERNTMFANTSSFQAAVNTSYPYTIFAALSGGGSVDVRTEQTGYVVKDYHVPDGYDQCEYIQSDGTEYLSSSSTVLFQSVHDIEFVCEILEDTGAKQCIFGTATGSSSKEFYNGLGVFPVFDPEDPQVGFLCGSTVTSNGSTMPLNTKMKVTIIGNVLSWYDMDDNLLGSITSESSRPYQTYYNSLFFDCGTYANGSYVSPMGAKSIARIYYFKVTDTRTGMLVPIPHYLVPCADPDDPTTTTLFNIPKNNFLNIMPYGSTGTFTHGQSVEKLIMPTNINNTTASRYSRIVVAGGAGGQGGTTGLGGDGGGLEGGNYTGDTSTISKNIPGKQDKGKAFETAGSGSSSQIGSDTVFFGSGGYGWYGGNSSLSGSTIESGGAGGSGYVYTADSYKPSSAYAPPEKFYLSDTVLTTGGNPVRGMTRIEVEVLENSSEGGSLLVIAGDDESYKLYDTETDTWSSILGVEELTAHVFEEYGVTLDSITSDAGLTFPYKLYVNDPFDTGVNVIYTYAVPPQQSITFSNNGNVKRVRHYLIDGEFDDNVTTGLNYELTDEGVINSELLMNMSDVIEKDSYVAMVQYRVTKNSSTEFEHTDLTKSGEEVLLYSTLTDRRIPADNKEYPYPYPYMPDGKTLISSITCSSACIHKRKVYVATLLNNTSIRVNVYDMTTNTCDMIIDDIAKSPLSGGGACGGSLLADENGVYLGNSFMNNATAGNVILFIPYDGSGTTRYRSQDSLSDTEKSRRNAYGQMFWYEPNVILSCAMNGFVLLNVTTGTFTHIPDDVNGDQLPVNSFAMGDYTVMECLYNENGTTEVRVFDRETLTAVAGYNVRFPSGIRCVSYSDGKFYVAQPGHLYILEDNDICKPTLVSDIPIPDDTLQPKTVDQTGGLIYITFSTSNVMYVYSTKEQSWTDITLPFVNPDYTTTGWHRPATFKGYIYLGDMELFVTNASMYNKYKVGERNSYVHAITNAEFSNNMTYDRRFITVDEDGTHIHAGYLDKALTPISEGSKIKETQAYLSTDYNRMLSHSFRKGD